MEITVNGGKTIINDAFASVDYSTVCKMAMAPESRCPSVSCLFPDGNECILLPGFEVHLVPGVAITVTYSKGA